MGRPRQAKAASVVVVVVVKSVVTYSLHIVSGAELVDRDLDL
jgi:hypothetical protein